MKSEKTRILAAVIALAVLSTAILLAGCGISAVTGANAGTFDLFSSLSGASVSAESADEAAGSLSDEAFTERDLTGAYDKNVTAGITLNGNSAESDSELVKIDGTSITITGAGTFIISGTLENGSITVDASKDDKVQLVLSGAAISSETFAAIYVKQADKVFITLAEGTENTLANGGSFVMTDDNNVDAVIFSKDNLTLNGTGSLTVVSPAGHGISCKDELVVTGGTYRITASGHGIEANDLIAISDGSFEITAKKDSLHSENDDDATLGNILINGGSFTIVSSDDGIHANTLVEINGGEFTIKAAEGVEGTYIRINDGEISISASDDGINAARKSSAYTPTVEINGGSITIAMGQGDTDGVDSNGNIIVNGGTVSITGNSSFDYDGTAQLNGGKVIVNGQEMSYIPNQMMGMGAGGFGGGRGGRR